jgi:prolyl-tRNA synthetase
VAPYHVHLLALAGRDSEVGDVAERAYSMLLEQEVEVLYDDRDESPGVKFADADLIGLPLRVTIGARSLRAGGAEVKARRDEEARVVPLEALAEAVRIE